MHGQVVSARSTPVAFASVVVQPANASCTPQGTAIGTVTDEHGQYQTVVDVGVGPAFHGCVVVEARSGGAKTAASALALFTSSKSDAQPVRVDVALPRAERPSSEERVQLVHDLAAAVNGMSVDPDLALHVQGGSEALRVALEQYRLLFGTVTEVRVLPADWSAYPFELRAANGRTGRVTVEVDDLVRLHSPLLDYGPRSERFVNAYIRAVASGDAVRLAGLLSPDDIDYPIEDARELIVAYRRRYGDTATIRGEFVDLDETRNTITWRLRGRGAGGSEITEDLVLRYGDGLLGVVGL
ncbi:MAG TPA: hypothetical protein VF701_19070 [Thermoanaerobaculia bacterium]